MAVACQAVEIGGGVCAVWGKAHAKKMFVPVGSILVPVRLCEAHERETNGGHLRTCTFNNYAKGDVCNCKQEADA